MKKEFNLEEFYEKAWSKQNSLELKKYISHAIREINSRNYDDTLSKSFIYKLGNETTGFTKKGNLSARVIGKTKEELMYEARTLHDYLNWDFTSDKARREIDEKYKRAYTGYLDKPNHMYISEEAYERYVELVFAFKDLSKAYSSEQIRTWFDYVEGQEELDLKDLQSALMRAADKATGPMSVEERRELVWDILEEIMYDKI